MPSTQAVFDVELRRAFDAYGLPPTPSEPKSQRFKVLRVKGNFMCSKTHDGEPGNKAWSSHYAWLTVDLHKQRVTKRWVQKCKTCGEVRAPYVSKEAFTEAVRKMMLEQLEHAHGVSSKVDRGLMQPNSPNKMHVPSLCEKCRFGLGCNCSGRGTVSLSEALEGLQLDYSKWADPAVIKSYLPTRAERESNVNVLNSVTRTLFASGSYLEVLEGGSRGKGTDLGCSDLDMVMYTQGFRPERVFVASTLRNVKQLLETSEFLELTGRFDVHVRSIGFQAVGINGHTVKCDLLLGGYDEDGNRPEQPSILASMSYCSQGSAAALFSPSFNHLQVRLFQEMPPAFRTLCRMAKVWLRNGTGVEGRSGASYMLELIVQKCGTPPTDVSGTHATISISTKLYSTRSFACSSG